MIEFFPVLFLLGWLSMDMVRGTMNPATPVVVVFCLVAQAFFLLEYKRRKQ
jgi:hypothetical protein